MQKRAANVVPLSPLEIGHASFCEDFDCEEPEPATPFFVKPQSHLAI
jgi:hypothetical protein